MVPAVRRVEWPIQNFLLFAELQSLGVCLCRITEGIGRVPVHNFIAFGRTEGIGCVPMRNFIAFGRGEGIRCVPMQKN